MDACCVVDLFKAAPDPADPNGEDRGVWALHPNRFIAALVEDITARFQYALKSLRNAFERALRGIIPPYVREVINKDPSQYSLRDWGTLVQALVSQHFSPEDIDSEAERMAVRSSILGQIQASLPEQEIPAEHIGHLTSKIPTRIADIPAGIMGAAGLSLLAIASARIAQRIMDLADTARRWLSRIVLDHAQFLALGEPEASPRALSDQVEAAFNKLDRDARRIAVTEPGEAANQAFIAAMPPHARVVRRELYLGACAWCRSIDGHEFSVVPASARNKDGDTQVWPGKPPISPASKRWPAVGPQHPNCRGWWEEIERRKSIPPALATWLDNLL